uniref:Uncharacterized protein n=1 Tax=Parascaris equorum TaxID=6256 RepID=A0A914RW51_PAREQ
MGNKKASHQHEHMARHYEHNEEPKTGFRCRCRDLLSKYVDSIFHHFLKFAVCLCSILLLKKSGRKK